MKQPTAADLANRLDGLADEARAESKKLRASQRDGFEAGYLRGAIVDVAKQLRSLDERSDQMDPAAAAVAITLVRDRPHA